VEYKGEEGGAENERVRREEEAFEEISIFFFVHAFFL